MTNTPIQVITFGVDSVSLTDIKKALPRVQFHDFPLEIGVMLRPKTEFEPDLIFCGNTNPRVTSVDAIQGVRSIYAQAPIYFATSDRKGFERKALIKQGYVEAFLMPMDRGLIQGLVSEGGVEFKTVPLVDISPETVLNFDTYLLLPMNRKHIKFSSAGYPLEAARAKRLLDHQVASVEVAAEEMGKFYEFTAAQLKKLARDPAISEAERRERTVGAVRSLLTGLWTGTAEMQDCSEIVHAYMLENWPNKDSLFEKILRVSGTGGEGYAHVSNVSTLAALFAMAVLPESVETVALAGLLHDIGIAELPPETQTRPNGQWTEDERKIYESHPRLSVERLRAKPIQLPDVVLRTIEQHHERFDGSGYPQKLAGDKILKEAQLISIADEFDYHTAVQLGRERVSPQQVLATLLKSPAYAPELLSAIAKVV